MLNINLLGSVYPTRAVVEGMKLKGSGRIIFVSSQVYIYIVIFFFHCNNHHTIIIVILIIILINY